MNLCGKQVFEFVLQCGVAFLIEIDRNGVGCVRFLSSYFTFVNRSLILPYPHS